MKLIFLTLILASSLFSFESFNYVNKNYKFTSEKELKNLYFTKISPYFYKQKIHYFSSFNNLKIAYRIFEVKKAKANIVISSGRTEGMLKYQELIYDLNNNGYSVLILDHRGQGNSQRVHKDTQLGHVFKFGNYVKDLKFFVDKYLPQDKKRILMGHSMGGAIASLYAQTYPNDFDALVLSSPMHQPEIISPLITTTVCRFIESRTRDIDKYIIGEKPYDEQEHIFENNKLTHSKIRYEITKIAFDIEPEAKIGGPSIRWLSEACRASAKSVDEAYKISIPVLLLQAGEDIIVNKKPQNEFYENVGKLCKAYKINGAYHELFIESDHMRDETLTAILDFISKI